MRDAVRQTTWPYTPTRRLLPCRYTGSRASGNATVLVWSSEAKDGDEQAPLPLRLDLGDHSPAGFAWGYGGAGPAQLALAILADFTGNDRYAVANHQSFKRDVIARLPEDRWELWGEYVAVWVARHPRPLAASDA